MSELQSYYDAFSTGYWATPDASECECGGGGWALSDVDTWHKCPCHFWGQPHPEEQCEDETAFERAAMKKFGQLLSELLYGPAVRTFASTVVVPMHRTPTVPVDTQTSLDAIFDGDDLPF